ncbi:M1 family metallopeptidase [Congregibacter litoralis]|uniref:Aminopeptidase N n=1 Tax=Congregibacter litoralis KT71 TaxID=314285 RepID=A4A765_9GAMM|nr:M1 family aminopeptidase [Congregibacter litoralis]EAQ98134.1 Aminopeptidase N [Congregibacter litoralis KT71]
MSVTRLLLAATVMLCCTLAACDRSSQGSQGSQGKESISEGGTATQALHDGELMAFSVEAGVSASLAKDRAERISRLSYELQFSVPGDRTRPLAGRAILRFNLAGNDSPLAIDFAQGADSVLSVSSSGAPVAYDFDKEHLIIPTAALREGDNVLTLDFIAPQDAVNRNPDYLFTLFVPDRARTVFPLFDQPDLKARYSLTLEVPKSWTALGNGRLAGVEERNGRRMFRFRETRAIPSYLFAFVAGEFEVVSQSVRGREMTLLHRETDGEKLARNLDSIFETHADALDWLEEYTAIDYPFDKFAFALIPDFPYGGMEHVGAIAYRASSLLLEESPSENQLLNRAQLIAHETAHMWFGNLVTMRWFNDVWTKEVFANFMADKVVNPQFPDTDHALNFLVSHYPQAYGVDRSEGANPIRQQLDNLNLAGQMYGPIIYHKAPIMMRQLELLLGKTAFRDGLRTYLTRFSYGNATWPALIEILDEKTPIDLGSWSEVWVNTPGMPDFALRKAGVEESSWLLEQTDPRGEDREWPQQFSVLSLRGASETDMLAARSAPLPESVQGAPQADLLLNANGLGYGRFPVSDALFDAWQSLTPLQRGVLLVSAYEDLLARREKDALAYFGRLVEIVTTESNELLIELAASQLYHVYFSLLTEEERDARSTDLEDKLWKTLASQDSPSKAKLFFEIYSAVALSSSALEQVRLLWSGEESIATLSLQEAEKIRLAEILAVRLPDQAEAIIAAQREETQNPDRLRRFDYLAPALSPDVDTRDAFFNALKEPANRATEVWVSDALRRLHDPTRLEHSARYVLPSLELLEEIQVTGDIFFPSAWLNRTLGTHSTTEVAGIVRDFLEDRPDYNPQLRMKILQAADPLFRASHRKSKPPAQ